MGRNAETKFKHAGNKCECLLHQSSFKQMDLEVLESLRKGNIEEVLQDELSSNCSKINVQRYITLRVV